MTADASPDTNRIVVGIDLGTTNSLAAVVTRHGPRVLRAADGAALIPSVIAFPKKAVPRSSDPPPKPGHSTCRRARSTR